MFSGLRPGEKLFEEMFAGGEQYERTQHEKIFIAANASTFVPQELGAAVAAMEHAANSNDCFAVVRTLQNLIPEYCPPAESALTLAGGGKGLATEAKEWRSYGAQPSSQVA